MIAVANEERNEMLRLEEDRLNLKITQFESLIDLNYCQTISALNENVLKMEEFSSEYFILSEKLEMYLGDEYGAFYGPTFKHKTHEIGENMGRSMDQHLNIRLMRLVRIWGVLWTNI